MAKFRIDLRANGKCIDLIEIDYPDKPPDVLIWNKRAFKEVGFRTIPADSAESAQQKIYIYTEERNRTVASELQNIPALTDNEQK